MRLRQYVEVGGILLTGIPQFSTHIRRDFLSDMEDLALYQEGDLQELCGIRVTGKGSRYSGQWNSANRVAMPSPELSALPSDHCMEDGHGYLAEVELSGAQIVAWDSDTGKPMLVRYACGKGWVYTFTLWAYPGHEQFQSFCAAWIAELANRTLSPVYVEDPSREVFWTRWVNEGQQRILLLNTDWTVPGNEKNVTLVTTEKRLPIHIPEGKLVCATVENGRVEIELLTI